MTPFIARSVRRAATLTYATLLLVRLGYAASFAVASCSITYMAQMAGLVDGVAVYGVLLVCLSAIPAIVVAPPSCDIVRETVRSMDADAVVETAVFAPESAAMPIVNKTAERQLAAQRLVPFSVVALYRAIPARLKLAASAALVLLAASNAIAILHQNTSKDGSTDQLATIQSPEIIESRNAPLSLPDLEDRASTPIDAFREMPVPGTVRRGDAQPGNASAETTPQDGRRGTSTNDTPASEGIGQTGTRSSSPNASDAAGEQSPQVPQAESSSASAPPGSGIEGDTAARSAGYEGSGTLLSVDPMKPYRSYIERFLANRGPTRTAASDETTQSSAASFIDRYFASFRLSVTVDSIDDPLLETLRDSWRRRLSGDDR